MSDPVEYLENMGKEKCAGCKKLAAALDRAKRTEEEVKRMESSHQEYVDSVEAVYRARAARLARLEALAREVVAIRESSALSGNRDEFVFALNNLESFLVGDKQGEGVCRWTFDDDEDDSWYTTSCGNEPHGEYQLDELNYKHCPYCGKPVEEVKDGNDALEQSNIS